MYKYILYIYMIGGLNPSEDMKVSWDDDYSQYMENHKIHVPNHQSYIYIYIRSYHQHILSRSHISSPALGTSPHIDQSCPISSQLGLTLLKVISLLTSSQGPVRRKRGKIEKTFYIVMARNTSCKY